MSAFSLVRKEALSSPVTISLTGASVAGISFPVTDHRLSAPLSDRFLEVPTLIIPI